MLLIVFLELYGIEVYLRCQMDDENKFPLNKSHFDEALSRVFITGALSFHDFPESTVPRFAFII
jgi:hypothetical protein